MSVFLKRLSDKGKDITGLMGKQFEIFSARLRAMSHVTPDEAASICDELETGPWTDEQQDDLTALVGEKLSSQATLPAAAYRLGGGGRKQQRCEFFDNYLTEDRWKAIEANTNLSEVFRILGQQACEVGLVLPSEPTFKVMTAITVCCAMQQPSMADHSLHEVMEALKHIVKPMLAQSGAPSSYRVEYPVSPLELGPDVVRMWYGDAAPAPSPLSGEIHIVAAKKFARGSGRGLKAAAAGGACTTVAQAAAAGGPGGSGKAAAVELLQGLAALLHGGSFAGSGKPGGALPPGFRLLGQGLEPGAEAIEGLEPRQEPGLRCFRPRGEQLQKRRLAALPAGPASSARKEEEEAAEEEEEQEEAPERQKRRKEEDEEDAEGPLSILSKEMAAAAKAAKDSKAKQKAAVAAATAKAIYVHATLCNPTPPTHECASKCKLACRCVSAAYTLKKLFIHVT